MHLLVLRFREDPSSNKHKQLTPQNGRQFAMYKKATPVTSATLRQAQCTSSVTLRSQSDNAECRNTPKRTVSVQYALAYSRERLSHSLMI